MKNKTILEWFEQAKANGAEWADEAISETRRLRGEERIEQKETSTKEALLGAFAWNESEQGNEYWKAILRSLPPKNND